MGVIDFYQGKNVLLTGTTGFVGKVMLEKFLRVLPNVNRIYILIRKKKGLNTMERFKKEVLGSKCFDRVRKLNPNFDEFINQKIRPVEGDLLKENVGLSAENFKELTENLHIIINCAASIDFNSSLDEAIEINVYGTLRMFQLAKSTKNLENFLHVSTAYSNSDKRGVIEEKMYEINGDPEKIIQEIYSMPKDKLLDETPRIIGTFPNTYTFTKSMVERILAKKRGDMPLTLVRPSIIGAAVRDPYVGWIDTVTAASAVFLLGGLGIMKFMEGDRSLISDQMPVDVVADTIVVAAAVYANQNKLSIVHSTSSSRNPIIGGESLDIIMNYWKKNPPQKRVAPCTLYVIENPKVAEVQKVVQRIPTEAYHKIAYTVGSAHMRKNADKLKKVMARTRTVSELYRSFASYEWIYLSNKIDEMKMFCTQQEADEYFFIDVALIDWTKYFQYFAWGLHHFVLGEKVEYPTNESDRMDLIGSLKKKTYFSDIKWAFTHGFDFTPRPKSQIKSLVLSSPQLKSVVQNLVNARRNKNISEEKYTQQIMAQASHLCDNLMSTYSLSFIKVSAYVLNTIIRTMYEKIVVDENSLTRLAQIDTKTKGPLVFLPAHRSFVDFFLVSYVFFSYKMKSPYVGGYEDFLRMALLPRLIRPAGGFFMLKDKVEHLELYNVIVTEYIHRLMMEDSWLQLFLEGTRSRYGKALTPSNNLLGMVTDAYFDKKVPDIQIVPVTLNYDRVVEADTFPFELLGEEKLKLSTRKLVMSYRKLAKSFGKVFIKFAEPISLKEYTQNLENQVKLVPESSQVGAGIIDPFTNKEHRNLVVSSLGLNLINTMNDNSIIMPTSMVASLLLLRRKGIAEEELVKKVDWLIQEIDKRDGKLGTKFAHIAVKSALIHLDELLERKKDVFHPSFSAKDDYKNIILLSYYRNMLGHIFFNEAIVACALASFGYQLAWKEGVPVDRLWASTSYLQKLVGKEFYTWKKLTKENFEALLATMIERETFKLQDEKVKISEKGEDLMNYLCSLIWPFIEGYWMTAVFLFTLKKRDAHTPVEKFEIEIQGFGEALYDERILKFYEACSIDTIKNALHVFKEWGVVDISMRLNEDTKKEVEVINLKASEAHLKEIIDNTHKFMKGSLANTMDVPVEIAKRSVLIDFPFMSKL